MWQESGMGNGSNSVLFEKLEEEARVGPPGPAMWTGPGGPPTRDYRRLVFDCVRDAMHEEEEGPSRWWHCGTGACRFRGPSSTLACRLHDRILRWSRHPHNLHDNSSRGTQLRPHVDDIDWLVATNLSRWNELQPEIDHIVFTLERTLLRILFNELVSDLIRF